MAVPALLAAVLSFILFACSLKNPPTEGSAKDAAYLRADKVFFRALDVAEGQPLANRVQVMQRIYVDGTSTLVGNYVRNRLGGGDGDTGLRVLLGYVDAHKTYYAAVRSFFDGKDPQPPVQQGIERVMALTGRSPNVQVVFFIGTHVVNAFVDDDRVGLALEWFLPLTSAAYSGLDSTVRQDVQRAGGFSRLPIWSAHEFTHILVRLPLQTVFDVVIDEGVSVAASELAVPGRPAHEYLGYTSDELDWALAHESQIWRDLMNIKGSTDPQVIHSYVSARGRVYPDGPGRIGYFIGYRVAQSYLSIWGGLRALAAETSPETILERSGYTP